MLNVKPHNKNSFLAQCANPKITFPTSLLCQQWKLPRSAPKGVGWGVQPGSQAPQIQTLQNTDCVQAIILNVLTDFWAISRNHPLK